MAKITLKPLDDGQKSVEIPLGKTTIGRGPFLGCGDKKVSRNHAVLEVNDQGEVYLTPTHVNPCFFQPTANSPGIILKKDKPHKLEHGVSFSLLPRAFRYKLVVEDEQNTEKISDVPDAKPEEKVNGMAEDKISPSESDAKGSEQKPTNETHNGEPVACVVTEQAEPKELPITTKESPKQKPEEEQSSSEIKVSNEQPELELNGDDSQEQTKSCLETTAPDHEESKSEDKKSSELEISQPKDEDEDDSNSRNNRCLPQWMGDPENPPEEEKKRPKPMKQHHREKAPAKRKTEANTPEKKKKRTERRKHEDGVERVEHPQRQSSSGRSSRTNRQTRQTISLDDFVASDDDEWQSDKSEPRHKKRRRSKRKDDDSGSDWEVEHKKSKKVSHKYSSGSESGSDWGTSSHKKKKGPKTRRRRSKRAHDNEVSEEEEEDEKSSVGKAEKRYPCQYGKKCYRKNPSHLDQCCHPGDSDFESEAEDKDEQGNDSEEDNDLPECPYGTNCFRKSVQHKKDYKHTKKVRPQREAAKQAGKKATVSKENDEADNCDLNDSLVNDDSDDYKPVESGSDFDSSQESSSPLKGNKIPIKNKRVKRV